MLRLEEVYRATVRYESADSNGKVSMQRKKAYDTRDCLLNPDYIVAIYPYYFETSSDRQMLGDKFSGKEQFSRIILVIHLGVLKSLFQSPMRSYHRY